MESMRESVSSLNQLTLFFEKRRMEGIEPERVYPNEYKEAVT
jgi:hypothetical protein